MNAFLPNSKRRLLTNICTNCLRRLDQQPLRPGLQANPREARRSLHTSHVLSEQHPQQAQPLGSYYESLLTPQPTLPSTLLPSFVPTSGDLTKEERAARLFGSISGSGYEHHTAPTSTWQTINGVAVPPRPGEPDNCCMSGCVHCVWDDYRDDIEQWAGRVREAQKKARSDDGRRPEVYMSRPEVEASSASMDDDGGGSEALWDAPTSGMGASALGEEELFEGIPVGIREFMATEKRIRERKKARRRS